MQSECGQTDEDCSRSAFHLLLSLILERSPSLLSASCIYSGEKSCTVWIKYEQKLHLLGLFFCKTLPGNCVKWCFVPCCSSWTALFWICGISWNLWCFWPRDKKLFWWSLNNGCANTKARWVPVVSEVIVYKLDGGCFLERAVNTSGWSLSAVGNNPGVSEQLFIYMSRWK